MEQQPGSSRILDQMLRELAEQVQRERGWRDINPGTTIGAGVAAFTQNVALGSGTSVYQTKCPDCGSSNLGSIAVRVDPKTDAPLGKRSILRTLATALLCFIIGLTVLILISISTLDEAMGTEGIWIVALPIIFVNLF